jgi:predicted permease
MVRNIRFAFRVLRKNPAFSIVAISSLAIGIGANSAIFSLGDALLLRPLPVVEPNRIVTVRMSSPADLSNDLSYRDYIDFRDRNSSFENLFAYSSAKVAVSGKDRKDSRVKYGLFVSGNFFRTLGVTPVVGRAFSDDEDKVPGRDAVVVLSHDMWLNDFAGDRSVIGQTLRLNGTAHTIVGVAPEHFTGIDQFFRPALFVPIAMSQRVTGEDRLEDRGARWLSVKGRLRRDFTIASATEDLKAIAHTLEQTYPATNRDQTARVKTEFQLRVEQDPPDAQLVNMLMILAGCVLLVACANVAGLQLSRSRARTREIAIRLAIGAKGHQLIGQLFIESLLLALGGGVAGTAVAFFATRFLNQAQVPTDLPIVISVQLDYRVLLFTLCVSLISTILSGLSAFRSTRVPLVSALKTQDADTAGKRSLWGRNALVAGQIGVSLMLLTVAALIYRGFERQIANGPGYRTSRLLLMNFDPSLAAYKPPQTEQFYKQLLSKVRSEAGIQSAALTSAVPLSPEQEDRNVVPEGYTLPRNQPVVSVGSSIIGDGYFQTVGISILRGRGFLTTDIATSPLVAVINQQFADRYWPNQDCIGKRIRLDRAAGPAIQVIGIVRTVKYFWIGEAPTPFIYLPLTQQPRTHMTLVAESTGEAARLAGQLRRAVQELDPSLPVYNVRTMERFYHDRAVKIPEMTIQTIGAMGLFGLILAIIGLYGLVAYSVSRRTREIGLRIAIGASRADVLGLFVKQGFTLAVIGIVLGVIGSLAADHLLRSVIAFDGSGKSLAVFVVTAVAQLLATLIATYVPARRATLIDPILALRND